MASSSKDVTMAEPAKLLDLYATRFGCDTTADEPR